MYFITVDSNNYLTGVYDGSLDYVHRITGDPIEGAFQVPDGAILITDMCMQMIRTAAPNTVPKWDPATSCIIQEADLTVEGKRNQLYSSRIDDVLTAEQTRVDALTEAELDAELGA